jgi:hypothetical protein
MDFLLRLEQSSFSTWIREGGSLWGYPAILFLHTIGLGTVAGVNAGINLRLLGFASRIPVGSLKQLFSLVWVAFAVTAVSGVILLILDATAKLASPIFYVKMVFVGLALVNMQMLKTRVFRNPLVDTTPIPSFAKILSLTSILLWIAATTTGRLMAYIGPSTPGN